MLGRTLPDWIKTEAKAMFIYIVILVVMIEIIDAKTAQIRSDINAYGRITCTERTAQSLRPRYDDFVRTMIAQQKTAEMLNLAKHDAAKAAADSAYATQLRDDLVPILDQNCAAPILP